MLHSRQVSMLGGGGGGIRQAAARGSEVCGRRNSGREKELEAEVEPATTLVRAATMTESSCSVVRVAGEKEEEDIEREKKQSCEVCLFVVGGVCFVFGALKFNFRTGECLYTVWG